MPELNYDDPCALLAVLRPAYYGLLGGSKAETIEFDAGNGVRRKVTYARSNINTLRDEVRRLEAACAAKTDGRPRRFAMTPGGCCR